MFLKICGPSNELEMVPPTQKEFGMRFVGRVVRTFDTAYHFAILRLRTSRILTIASIISRVGFPSKIFWTWNVYSLGYSLRKGQNLSRFTSLNFSSDHGIALEVKPLAQEEAIPAGTHFTWCSWREGMEFANRREVVRIQHPWIQYRSRLGLSRKLDSQGTLVFGPHSVVGYSEEFFDLRSYIELLSALPSAFGDLTYCLHPHDVSYKTIDTLRKAGVRVTTAGNSLHPLFAQRFYKIAAQHKYATSPKIGSHLFYCHEFGLEFFLYDPELRFQRTLTKPEGQVEVAQEYKTLVEEAFMLHNVGLQTKEKNKLVSEALGLDLANERFSIQSSKE